MLKSKKFFVIILSVLTLLLQEISGAFALTVTVSNCSHTLTNNYLNQNNSSAIYLNGNESFSVTFTATDVQGTTVGWQIQSFDVTQGGTSTSLISDLQFTSSDNTATLTGTLNDTSTQLDIMIVASDLNSEGELINTDFSTSTTMYAFYCLNRAYFFRGESTVSEPPSETVENLHVAIIEPVSEEYQTDDLLKILADNVNTERSNIQWLPADAITTSEPPEPTQAMRDKVASDSAQFVAKLNTIKVSEDGYYAFQVTVSDDLVGTNVSELRLYYAEDSDFTTSSANDVRLAFGLMPIINGVTGALEVSDFFGVKLDTLPKKFLATMFLTSSKSLTVYIVKILIALFTGGCVIGGSGLVFAAGYFLIRKFYKRRS
ncbi:MAG: hypothetical protein IJ597_06105 [Synergistaceae bacterium]|nr:hypothetical protein [Synergistaceae bacterium]